MTDARSIKLKTLIEAVGLLDFFLFLIVENVVETPAYPNVRQALWRREFNKLPLMFLWR